MINGYDMVPCPNPKIWITKNTGFTSQFKDLKWHFWHIHVRNQGHARNLKSSIHAYFWPISRFHTGKHGVQVSRKTYCLPYWDAIWRYRSRSIMARLLTSCSHALSYIVIINSRPALNIWTCNSFWLVMPYGITKFSLHWFKWWHFNYLWPSHCLKQCWHIIDWTLRDKMPWDSNQNIIIFSHENAFKMLSAFCQPFCS